MKVYLRAINCTKLKISKSRLMTSPDTYFEILGIKRLTRMYADINLILWTIEY